MSSSLRISADIGGTFTDLALITQTGVLVTRKVPSTPDNYADAVIKGIEDMLINLNSDKVELFEVLHGCTVATNTILEMKGAKTALLTTKNFRDILEIQRVRVPELYKPLYEKPKPLVPRNLRFGIPERISSGGEIIVPLVEEEIIKCAKILKKLDIEAVSVCYLNSYANPIHEVRTGEILRKLLPDAFISISAEVLPQMREYERTSTTVINSYVGPPVKKYIESLVNQMKNSGFKNSRLMVMQSSGGILDSDSVVKIPAQIIECGPAAGVIGAQFMSKLTGYENLITLDMGGTTAKASLIEKSQLSFAEEYEVGGGMSSKSALGGGGGYALKLPVIDISEVGAGGGSIAWLDKANSLKIGPESAGARPGPVCYGFGNEYPTVTDANVLLGYLNPEGLAGNSVPINPDLSRKSIEKHIAKPLSLDILTSSYGIHQVANANMMRAVKAVTTLRGRDPRDFSLLAFGGSGGVHAVELAKTLQIKKVILPLAAGVYSALGLLWANLMVNETLPFLHLTSNFSIEDLNKKYKILENNIRKMIRVIDDDIIFERKLDARFLGQAYELTIDFPSNKDNSDIPTILTKLFEEEHKLRYGHSFSGEYPVQLVNLRMIGRRKNKSQILPRAIFDNYQHNEHKRNVYFGPSIGLVESKVISRKKLGRKPIKGPIIIEEYEGTAVVPPDCTVKIDSYLNVIIEIKT
jgi:N-methylhydantoinase A|tara:strand:- start:1647 stop:3731 length:2085 start_codon:yes stop_codon:yes gene_type:complete